MLAKPLVSIIIPTYNRAELIGETIDSIISQTYKNWECIIVDDGSTDHTAEVIENYCNKDTRIKYYVRKKKYMAGGNGARNYGFDLSKGEYVQWFDSDDIMLPNKINDDVQEAIKYNLDFVISSGYSSNFNLKNLRKKVITINDDLYINYTTWQTEIFLPSLFFLKQFISKFDLFDETLSRGQENEFFSRVFFLSRNLAKYKVSRKYNYIYRQHGDNKKTNQKKSYVSSYIKSFAYLSLVNMERGFKIKNKEVLNFHFNNLKKYFFLSLNNKDIKVSKFIYLNLTKKLLATNLKIGIIFCIVGFCSFIKGQTPYKLKKTLANYSL